MTLVILVIAVINLIVIYFFGKKLRNPLIYLVFWWYFWLFISTFSISGLNTPSDEVYAIYILMLISAMFGALFFYYIKNSFGGILKDGVKKYKKQMEADAYYLLLKITKYISAPVVLFYFLKSLYVMSSVDDIGLYRDIVFATGEVESAVFGTGAMQFIYGLTVGGFIFIGVIVGAAGFVTERKKELLVISSVLFCMDAIMMLGRFNFYIFLTNS
jgi:hypothetical protein